MFPTKLFLSTILIYTYLILVYARAMNGDTVFLVAANTALVSCSGAAGMACFAFGFRRLSEGLRRRAPLYMAGLCAAGELCLDFVPPLFTVGVALSVSGWGFLTAYILYRTATEVTATYFGRFIGVSYGFSAFLQFMIGTADAHLPALSLTQWLALPCLAAFTCLSRGDSPKDTDAALPAQKGSPAWHAFFLKSRTHLLFGAALLSLLMGFSDSVTILHFDEYAPAFPASRLCYAIGLIFFGWLADRRFTSLPAIALFMNAYYLWFCAFQSDTKVFLLLSQLVEAIYFAPIIILLTVGFLHAAARSDCPDRWAAMGRIVGLPLTSLGLVLGLRLWPAISTATMLAVYTTLLLVAVVLLYRGALAYLSVLQTAAEAQFFVVAAASGLTTEEIPTTDFPPADVPAAETPIEEPAFSQAMETPIPPQATYESALSDETVCEDAALPAKADHEETFAAYCRRYNLTAKEAEVLTEILKGQNVEEIAEAQFITKRTVRFHISNLLRKTGNKTQITMIAHFHQTAGGDAQLETEEKKSGTL